MNPKELIIRSQLISWLLLNNGPERSWIRRPPVNSYHSCCSTFKKYCAREWTFKVNSYHSCYPTGIVILERLQRENSQLIS